MIAEARTDSGESSLVALGYEKFRAQFADLIAEGLEPGRVVKTVRGHIWVATAEGVIRVRPAGSLTTPEGELAAAVVGDWIAIRPATSQTDAFAELVMPRRSAFARRDPGKASVEQVLAANIDTVFIVQSVEGGPNLRRIERELALAWDSGAVPVVVLSKADLSPDPAADIAQVTAIAPGVDVVAVSSLSGEGTEEIEAMAGGERTIALIGPSGAGKSTLVNRIVGGDVMKVGEVRAFDHKGRHTTVTRELIPLAGGGALIDTPGLRAVALAGEDGGVDTAFSEIAALAPECRYDDCTHEVEPGCAVLAAVESGELTEERYQSYLALKREAAFEARKADARLQAEETRKWKIIHKSARAYFKEKRDR